MESILIIDDDTTLRRALRLTLERSGYRVFEAGDGREGLGLLKREIVDLVITDLIMPGMEGLETIRELRKLNPSLRIIAISGGGRGTPAEYLDIATQFGAAKVFTKPFDFSALCSAVSGLLGSSSGV